MSKSKQAEVSWVQAPDGSWHPITPSGVTTMNIEQKGGCGQVVGAILLLLVLGTIGIFILGVAGSGSKPTPTTTTTTSTTLQ
jgi:hypothetical protein